MGRAKPVVLQTRSFRTQTEAKEFFASMLDRYQPGDRVAAQDAQDLEALLQRHAQRSEKVGVGIDHFIVDESDMYGSWCFFIVRVDGTLIDFSYRHCIDGR
jgi:hypothetical protein